MRCFDPLRGRVWTPLKFEISTLCFFATAISWTCERPCQIRPGGLGLDGRTARVPKFLIRLTALCATCRTYAFSKVSVLCFVNAQLTYAWGVYCSGRPGGNAVEKHGRTRESRKESYCEPAVCRSFPSLTHIAHAPDVSQKNRMCAVQC